MGTKEYLKMRGKDGFKKQFKISAQGSSISYVIKEAVPSKRERRKDRVISQESKRLWGGWGFFPFSAVPLFASILHNLNLPCTCPCVQFLTFVSLCPFCFSTLFRFFFFPPLLCHGCPAPPFPPLYCPSPPGFPLYPLPMQVVSQNSLGIPSTPCSQVTSPLRMSKKGNSQMWLQVVQMRHLGHTSLSVLLKYIPVKKNWDFATTLVPQRLLMLILPVLVFDWFCTVAWYWAYAASLATNGCFCSTLAFLVGGFP